MVTVVKDDEIQIDRLELGPFGTNAYIVFCLKTKDSLVVDAPADAGRIIDCLKGSNARYILLTHDHIDHLGALDELRSRLKIPLGAHAWDAGKLTAPPEVLLNDGDEVAVGNIRLDVLHTPGHTPGSLCFRVGKYVLAGDTVFPGGPGKTSSPENFRQVVKSITGKILVLPEDTELYPGHGDATTVKQVKEELAFFSSRPHDPNLCGDVLWLTS